MGRDPVLDFGKDVARDLFPPKQAQHHNGSATHAGL
jgi:hypothetical protein